MHRLSLGDFELTAVSDGIYYLDGGAFFGVVPKVLWERKVKADQKNRVPSGLNSLLVRTGDCTVLVETGIGNKLSEKMAEIYGQPAQLIENLAAAGVSPDDVDIVINTHLHFDHCGWNTARQGGRVSATFPNATYYVQEGEWNHAHENQRDGVSYLTDNYDCIGCQRADETTAGRSGNRSRHFTRGFPRTHKRHAGGGDPQRGEDGLLHFGSDSYERAPRSELGDGV